MKSRQLIYALSLGLLFSACSTPQVGYFQDIESGTIQNMPAAQIITIQPGDKLSILVSSKNPDLAYIYNLPIVSHYDPSNADTKLSTSQVANYQVDENGNIDFPRIGSIHIAGMTRSQVSNHIKDLLRASELKDATVTVDFLDLYISVIGEVNRPGRFIIDKDRMTLIDAISRAGDLTIYGKRDNVLVLRQENGTQKTYRIDLSNAQQIYSSPAFYLKQNDMVYVEPNATKARLSTASGNTFSNPSFWVSVASLLTAVAVLVFKK